MPKITGYIEKDAETGLYVARKIIESCIQHGDRLPKNLAVGQRPHFKLDVKIPVPVET